MSEPEAQKLWQSCHELAVVILEESSHPMTSQASLVDLTRSFVEIVLDYQEFFVHEQQDPAVVLHCVDYLRATFARYAIGDPRSWLYNSLGLLTELVYPCEPASHEQSAFWKDLERGASRARDRLGREEP